MDINATPDSGGIISRFYNRTVLQYPWFFILLTLIPAAFFGYYLKDFGLDASSDSIVLENDKDLAYYDYTREEFGSDDYIFVTMTPREGSLVSDENIDLLSKMTAEFAAMPAVASVTSILNVPLFESPKTGTLLELATNYKTLATGADRELALKELTSSPLYKNYLVSEDGRTAAIEVTFRDNPDEFKQITNRRKELREKESLTPEEHEELAKLNIQYSDQYAALIQENDESIATVREIVSRYNELGELHMGGVPMIMSDIIAYVRGDIVTFAAAVTVMVIVVLAVFLRRLKWVVMPTAICVFSVVIMIGYMGFSRWNGTIVTSNFPSLLFVIALADAVHFAVKYREIYARFPDWTNRQIIRQTANDIALPCLYTSLTTIVGFGSLIVSGIRPVMDFGILMAMGVALAFAMTFLFVPAGVMYFPKGRKPPASMAELAHSPLEIFGRLTERHRYTIVVASAIIVLISVVGITRLKVENRFIDYFHEDTEIYQGMSVIDSRLGGTTPLEIVLAADKSKLTPKQLNNFWLQEDNRRIMEEVHTWFDGLPETGKVLSPHTMDNVVTKINDGNRVPSMVILAALQQVPKEIEVSAVGPYLSDDRTQARFSTRVQETDKSLSRKDLLATIHDYFNTSEIFKDGTIVPHVTGVFVLYNNMLQSLFRSQIVTIAAVFGVIWLMFILLFRSFVIATIAIMPNVLPTTLVLGTLGWSGKPLDMMTIMTAAVTLGLAVDFAIHYVHRFKYEFKESGSYITSMYRTNNSIGRALFYTTVTIIAGFSVLAFSHFIPSIYFGLFTSLSIFIAFIASITLLPLLLLLIKPLGPSRA